MTIETITLDAGYITHADATEADRTERLAGQIRRWWSLNWRVSQ